MYFIHQKLRPHQESTLKRIQNSRHKYIILQAPTGSGKSFFPAQLAAWGNQVMTLTKTKSLQVQYRDNYDFAVLFGKANYACNNYQDGICSQGKPLTADLCTADKETRLRCCQFNCEYPIEKANFLDSNAGSLNYSKFLLDKPLVDKFDPQWLFLDEAHELSDVVCDFSGITLSWKSKRLAKYTDSLGEVGELPLPMANIFLSELLDNLNSDKPLHPSRGGDAGFYRWHSILTEKVSNTLYWMQSACWFVYSDQWRFVCKPLTARFHFERLFDKSNKVVLMSATIGRVPNLVRELGITDYEYIEVPDIWPAVMRPIENLKGPQLRYNSPESDLQRHADLISAKINQCPEHWTGLIHSPSKHLAFSLVKRLRIDRPIYTPESGQPTDWAIKDWQSFNLLGNIGIFWQLWEGYDGGEHQICGIAKAPFMDFSNPYDRARFDYDRKAAYQRMGNKLAQGLGRTRRGRESDYGVDSGCVFIADSNWTRLRGYLDKNILSAIR